MKKGGKKPSAKGSLPTPILYAFRDGVIYTCEVSTMHWEQHKTVFRHHRCGCFQERLYLLEQDGSCFYDDPGHPLRESGTLKVYNLRSKIIESKVSMCRSNRKITSPFAVRTNEIIDIGKYPRLISTTSGTREPLMSLVGVTDFTDFSACLVLNKSLYFAISKTQGPVENPKERVEQDDTERDEEDTLEALLDREKLYTRNMDATVVYKVNCLGFTLSELEPQIKPPLSVVSLLPLTAGEFLVLGKRDGQYVAYSLTEKRAQLEGSLKEEVGRCYSSAVLGGELFMCFDSGLVARCALRSGLCRVYDFPRFQKIKHFLWVCSKRRLVRLPCPLMREIWQYVELTE